MAASSDEYPAGKTKSSTKGSDPVHKNLGTSRFMTGANENRVFIAIIIMIICFVASQLLGTRDSAMIHEYRLNQMELDIIEIKSDVKSLLGRADK